MSVARSVVYFAYLGDEGTDDGVVVSRLAFADRQFRWLSDLIVASGERIEVLVPYVAPRAWDADVHRAIARHGFRIDPASIRSERRNTFEYPGFRALKTLAESAAPDDLIYYCHSKGIVHLDEIKMGLFRWHTEVGLTVELDGLTAFPGLTRAGIFPSKFGWCWYNFFWIKADYMAGLAVNEHADRYQFEALIGHRGDKAGYRGVLPLIDRRPIEETGIAVRPWYRAEETTSRNCSPCTNDTPGWSRPLPLPNRANCAVYEYRRLDRTEQTVYTGYVSARRVADRAVSLRQLCAPGQLRPPREGAAGGDVASS